MKLLFKLSAAVRCVTLTLTIFCATPSLAQLDPSRLTPETAEQFLSLSDSTQRAAARQFGIPHSDVVRVARQVLDDQRVKAPPEVAELSQVGRALLPQTFESTSTQIEHQDSNIFLEKGRVEDSILEDLDAVGSEPGIKSTVEGLDRFGASLFDPETAAFFQQADHFYVPDDYRLGVGDELTVSFYGASNSQSVGLIDRDGRFFIPEIGPLSFVGLTIEDAVKLLDESLSDRTIGQRALLSLTRLRSINVVMAGEVNAPGAYVMSGVTSVMQALFQAGGINDIGSLRNIKISRADKEFTRLDLYDLLLRGDTSADVRLRSGDVVFVPPVSGEIIVEGAVRRPMRYEPIEGQTISDALDMAGGLIAEADKSSVVLQRFNGGDRGATSEGLDLDAETARQRLLNDGDRILVKEVTDFVDNRVRLTGAVRRQGDFAFSPGMTVTEILPSFHADFEINADDDYALIVSSTPESSAVTVTSFSPRRALRNPGGPSDPLLSPNDEVLIFSRSDSDVGEGFLTLDPNSRAILMTPVTDRLRLQSSTDGGSQLVSISGAVNFPGGYPLEPNMTVDDLIRAGGGLKSSAYVETAELRSTVVLGGLQTYSYEPIPLVDLKSGRSRSLSPRDHLTVREIPDWEPENFVSLGGEVKFPGDYLITSGETIRDLVRRAGGLRSSAYPKGAVFTRQSIIESESAQISDFTQSIRKNFASSLLTEESTSVSLTDIRDLGELLESFESSGRVVIDLDAAMAGDVGSNLLLEPGDSIFVPRLTNTIAVIGEVRRPGTQTFSEVFSIQDYLDLSAGYTSRADKSGVFIVRVNGAVDLLTESNWLRFERPQYSLMPGDTIVVPVNYEYKESLASWKDVTQIIYQGMVSIAAIARL